MSSVFLLPSLSRVFPGLRLSSVTNGLDDEVDDDGTTVDLEYEPDSPLRLLSIRDFSLLDFGINISLKSCCR